MNATAALNLATVAAPARATSYSPYARALTASKRARWDIDADVIRGRDFDYGQKFLPDALTKVHEFGFLTPDEARLLSQVQGRTYAYIFGLVERFIGAKVLELTRNHWLGDQIALESLVRFSDEELKHQALFRRLEQMMDARMPAGYTATADPDAVARAVLGKSTWAVLALTCHIELFTQSHYQQSIEPTPGLSPLFRDVFYYHWREEAQHAQLDELEWEREHMRLDEAGREQGVTDLIELVGAVDGILQAQAAADADWFIGLCNRRFGAAERQTLAEGVLKAYRWQYIVSGVQHPHFARVLRRLTTPAGLARIETALASLLG